MAAEKAVDRLAGGLRILVADEDQQALDGIAAILRDLGHEVVARATSPPDVADAVEEEQPDVAMVKLHADDEHALDLIDEVRELGNCPVIALLDSEDPEFIARAADRGITAYARPVESVAVQSSLEIAVRRFAKLSELNDAVDELEDAITRRATIERAKGILMERHGVSEREAFEMLRHNARSNNRRVHDVASEVS